MGRILNQRQFQINHEISIHCQSEKTGYGFRHLATVFKNGNQVGFAKASYYNRTWESYEFETVAKRAVTNSSLSPQEKEMCKRWLSGDRTDWSGFQTTAQIAQLGNVFAKDKIEKNIWKKRMLQAGLGSRGLEFPEDWGKLNEGTKEARLDAVINQLAGMGKPVKKKSRVHKHAEDIEKKISKLVGL